MKSERETFDEGVDDAPDAAALSHAARRSQRLAWLGGLAVVALAVYRVYTTELQDPVLVGFGVALIALGAWPAIVWARNGEARMPTFEVLALTFIPFYAFPLFDARADVAMFATEVVRRAALMATVFLGAAVLAFKVTTGRVGRSAIWSEPLLPDAFLRFTPAGLLATTVYLYVAGFTELIPPDFGSILRAVFYGTGMLCTFILTRQWGQGELGPAAKVFVAVNLLLQSIIHIAGLYLISSVSLFLLALIGYVSASRRLPLVVSTIGLVIFGALHLGKAQMRDVHWVEDAPRLKPSELPAFLEEWVGYSLAAHEESDKAVTQHLLERASLFHVLCRVVDVVPERQEYLGGQTYAIIPAQLVPRLLWPDKPGPHVSNRLMALYFGFVPDEEAAEKVSIAIGIPSEAYANFGLAGVVVLGCVVGFFYKKLATLTTDSPPLSVGGLAAVLLMAWSLQAEMTMAVWLTSLYQTAVVLVGIPVVAKRFFGW